MSDFEEYTKIIKNMPISCTYCGKKHDKDKIQYIQLLGSKREHVCNKECAIGYADREITLHLKQVDILKKRSSVASEM